VRSGFGSQFSISQCAPDPAYLHKWAAVAGLRLQQLFNQSAVGYRFGKALMVGGEQEARVFVFRDPSCIFTFKVTAENSLFCPERARSAIRWRS
jgi:hypothetical protein